MDSEATVERASPELILLMMRKFHLGLLCCGLFAVALPV
jgi:hypothetical protein